MVGLAIDEVVSFKFILIDSLFLLLVVDYNNSIELEGIIETLPFF